MDNPLNTIVTTFKEWKTQNESLEIHKETWGYEISGTAEEIIKYLQANVNKTFTPNTPAIISLEIHSLNGLDAPKV